jgi:hypothetical protein
VSAPSALVRCVAFPAVGCGGHTGSTMAACDGAIMHLEGRRWPLAGRLLQRMQHIPSRSP